MGMVGAKGEKGIFFGGNFLKKVSPKPPSKTSPKTPLRVVFEWE
jgi:hypothetical protein